MPEPTDAQNAAWEQYLDSIEEPPFSEDHHRFHTPNRPGATCATCVYRGWHEPEDCHRDLFMAGWAAGRAALLSEHPLP